LNWYLEAWKKYAVFDGRARRTEYWMFMLFNWLIGMVFSVLYWITWYFSDSAAFGIVGLALIYSLAVFIPTLAVEVRRLHDTGRSGWWLLITLVPFGDIVLLIFFLLDSNPGSNQYGPNPKGVSASPYGYPQAGGYQASATGIYCRNCGTLVPQGSSFCQNCGAKMS
jgi:uncharacterized membrane protein YhaH (DUF805 family)